MNIFLKSFLVTTCIYTLFILLLLNYDLYKFSGKHDMLAGYIALYFAVLTCPAWREKEK